MSKMKIYNIEKDPVALEAVDKIMKIILRHLMSSEHEAVETVQQEIAAPLLSEVPAAVISVKKTNRKLIITDAQVNEIRELSKKGWSSTKIATVYPCSARYIRSIVSGKSRKTAMM